MNGVGTIADIPKAYTAIAEWLSCILYLSVCSPDSLKNKKTAVKLVLALGLLIVVQMLIGRAPVFLWIPGMMVAAGIMFAMFVLCGGMSKKNAGYWLVRAFILAEMTASLEWQLDYFFLDGHQEKNFWAQSLFLAAVYGVVFVLVFFFEKTQSYASQLCVTKKELMMTVGIGGVTFCMSNLSYVYSNTPFSSPLAREAFNIRTLMDIAGFAFLCAYHIQRCEDHMKTELDAIQNILRTQYAQYRMSQENIDMINHKYHDLKHQIAVLRNESNLERREQYLDELEQGITDYEAQFKTGNSVLDTILTGKSLYCSRQGITLTCVADGSLLNGIYVMDLCTIFGNALDNAVECEVQIADQEKRLIHVSVSRQNNFVFIRIENYIEGPLEFHNDLPVSTKKDRAYHGFGLKSIRYSAEKYNGTMTVSVEDNWFVLKVLIPETGCTVDP